MDHLFPAELPSQSSCSKDGIDDLRSSKGPYYSKSKLISTRVQLIFGKVLRISKAGLCRSSMRLYWPRLQYCNSPSLRHFCSISEIYQHFEVGHRYVQLQFIILAQKGVIF